MRKTEFCLIAKTRKLNFKMKKIKQKYFKSKDQFDFLRIWIFFFF